MTLEFGETGQKCCATRLFQVVNLIMTDKESYETYAMKVTLNPSTDAAYIYLKDEIGAGEVSKTYCCDPVEVNGQIQLDFDSEGRLVGVEVLDASHRLPREVLENLIRNR